MADKSQIIGYPVIRRMLQSVEPTITAELRETIRAAAGMALREMLARVPRRTGKLASSLRFVITSNGLRAKVGIFGKRALKVGYYGIWVEFGTGNTPAKPWFYPALRAREGAIVKSIDAAVGRALTRIANGGGVTSTPPIGDQGEE